MAARRKEEYDFVTLHDTKPSEVAPVETGEHVRTLSTHPPLFVLLLCALRCGT